MIKVPKLIRFEATTDKANSNTSRPRPAIEELPDWYKEMPIFPGRFREIRGTRNLLTAKACAPLYDAFTGGYIMKTWCEIFIDYDDDKDEILYQYAGNPEPFIIRTALGPQNTLQRPYGFYPQEFAWQSQWHPHTPPGYSCLITHPLNRYDLPFLTTSGIMDTDKDCYAGVGNLPFYIYKGWTGTLPIGTPMYQIIPFKRDNWDSEELNRSDEEKEESIFRLSKHLVGGYKKEHWVKKRFR